MRPVTELQRAAKPFEVISPYSPSGDQPTAIAELTERLRAGEKDIVLLGATGTGKSATTAWLVEQVQRPTLILEPNKTLAAQMAAEFRELLPNNAVEYFVSYYDYYQPEAYVPQTDTFIEKDSSINDEVERLRHSATNSLLTRRDVVVVSSVSCIYGLGTPQEYVDRMTPLEVGQQIDRDDLLRRFVTMQYTRNDIDFTRGTFRVRGDTVEIIPMYEELAIRIEFFGDEIEALATLHPVTGDVIDTVEQVFVFPASHYVAGPERMQKAIEGIEAELAERLAQLEHDGRLLEAQRLRMRTTYDLEMLQQIGMCSGIENYSLHIDGRETGTPPNTLLDYFPEDFLLVIDESHVTVPQIGAMHEGDASRKRTLVEHGFRLPSALDNRPLTFAEFEDRVGQTVYLSATPGDYETQRSDGVVEQIIRPTGLVDPKVVVKPTQGQIDDLLEEVRARVERQERILVTTLTKRMAEDLTTYLAERGVRVGDLPPRPREAPRAPDDRRVGDGRSPPLRKESVSDPGVVNDIALFVIGSRSEPRRVHHRRSYLVDVGDRMVLVQNVDERTHRLVDRRSVSGERGVPLGRLDSGDDDRNTGSLGPDVFVGLSGGRRDSGTVRRRRPVVDRPEEEQSIGIRGQHPVETTVVSEYHPSTLSRGHVSGARHERGNADGPHGPAHYRCNAKVFRNAVLARGERITDASDTESRERKPVVDDLVG